ncbi:MAG: hypothetical protein IJD22_04525 [Clostridia bacterium]|nr:hypothetical protein [Clostridia bacterium]
MKTKRILAFIIALIMAFSLFSCSKGEDGKDGGSTLDIAGAENLDSAPAVWSDTTVVTENMYVYFYNVYYRYYLETNRESLEFIGLDPSKSLSEQKHSEEYNWQQYMTIQVYQQLREMIALADAAKAESMTLDEAELEKVEAEVKKLEETAASYGADIGTFLEKSYGKGVTIDVVRSATQLRALANKYYNKLMEGYTFTEEECLAEYEASRESFVHFDYIKVTVLPEDAPALTATTDKDSFISAMRTIITKRNFLDDYDRFSDTIEQQVKKKQYFRADYDPNSEFSQWVVDEARKAYDIYTKTESTGNITVAMILPASGPGAVSEVVYRDDVPLKNVMYMVFADSQGTSGVTKANTIYKNWQENPTAERFEELCDEYSGGKAENVARHQFNDQVDEWVFAEGRAEGDCTVLETEGGAYLLYVMADGEPSWLTDVKESLRGKAYDADMETIIDTYTTQYAADFIYNVVEVRVVEPSVTDTGAATEDTSAAAQAQ